MANFNPHEREARDWTYQRRRTTGAILIHTSVKLVTHLVHAVKALGDILIHTSVKLVTQATLKF